MLHLLSPARDVNTYAYAIVKKIRSTILRIRHKTPKTAVTPTPPTHHKSSQTLASAPRRETTELRVCSYSELPRPRTETLLPETGRNLKNPPSEADTLVVMTLFGYSLRPTDPQLY